MRFLRHEIGLFNIWIGPALYCNFVKKHHNNQNFFNYAQIIILFISIITFS